MSDRILVTGVTGYISGRLVHRLLEGGIPCALFRAGAAADDKGIKPRGEFTAVTLAITKKPGANAVDIARQIAGSAWKN